MDKNTQTFLDLVDCQPEDVRDVPAGRLDVNHGLEVANLPPAVRRASLGEKEIHFGKHKGKKLKELPQSYFVWALDRKSPNKFFRKFQQNARDYLRLSNVGPTPGRSRGAAA
jgi:hypothetical protein